MIGYCDSCQKTTEVRMLDFDHKICEECCGAGWDNLAVFYDARPTSLSRDWSSTRNEIVYYFAILVILGILVFFSKGLW